MKTLFRHGLMALALLALTILNSQLTTAHAQGTAFTYQGQLNANGAPANGSYDLAFTLFSTNTSGVAIAGPVTNSVVSVTNGLFTTTVDFGNAFTGGSNWLQIAVSTNGANTFSPLLPRQQLTPVPYAVFASSVSGLNIQPNGTSPNVILGYSSNSASGSVGATIGGGGAAGFINSVISSYGTVAGGVLNTAGSQAAVGGGNHNSATGLQSTIAGGYFNVANGNGTVGGGFDNQAGNFATVGGGSENNASGYGALIGGGGTDGSIFSGNTASGNASVVAGGVGNQSTNSYATVGGGYNNVAGDLDATVGGGTGNTASAPNATVSGGTGNTANGGDATVSGGSGNTAGGGDATVAGGIDNIANGNLATVAGGAGNNAGGTFSFAAGHNAQATNDGAFVWADSQSGNFSSTNNDSFNVRAAGGARFVTSGAGLNVDGAVKVVGNFISGLVDNGIDSGIQSATIAGGGPGQPNLITNAASYAAISGGKGNVIGGTGFGGSVSVIAGGDRNTVSGQIAAIGGGQFNNASGNYAAIPGGANNVASGLYSFAAGQQARATNNGAFVWADSVNGNFDSTNNDSFNVRAAGGARFVTSGAGLTVDGPMAATRLRSPGAGINTGTYAFIQRAVSTNVSGNITLIYNPITDNDPNAILIVTHNWTADTNSTTQYNTTPVGVYYNGTHWTIFNEDVSAMALGRAFNVLVIKR